MTERPHCTIPPLTLVGAVVVGGALWALIAVLGQFECGRKP